MLMDRATYEGLLRLAPGRRPFVRTPAGWGGVERGAWAGAGDCRSDWPGLRQVVPMVLGLGLSGVGCTGPDVGGFKDAPTPELYTRWFQLGAFMPFFRSHTDIRTPDQEPWSYGEPHLSIHREFLRLRYALLPYLYTAVRQASVSGTPPVRPLWWPDAAEPRLLDVDDAFFLGDALLVAPVLEPGATERSIELPGGLWYDHWTDEPLQGPASVRRDAPLEHVPLL
jgi:alpha-glucosidase